MLIPVAFILSGLWRTWHGIGTGPRWLRLIVGLAVALWATWIGTASLYALPLALLVMMSMNAAVSKGIKAGWDSWLMGLRYSLPALLVVAPSWMGLIPMWLYGLPYVGLCVVGGLVYPIMSGIEHQRYIRGEQLDWSHYGEFVVGALVIGGLAIL